VIFIASLAVYKAIHLTTSLLPREVMPWVKVVAGVVFGFLAAWLANLESYVLSSLAVATLAGATHTIIRLLTYVGDMAARRATK